MRRPDPIVDRHLLELVASGKVGAEVVDAIVLLRGGLHRQPFQLVGVDDAAKDADEVGRDAHPILQNRQVPLCDPAIRSRGFVGEHRDLEGHDGATDGGCAIPAAESVVSAPVPNSRCQDLNALRGRLFTAACPAYAAQCATAFGRSTFSRPRDPPKRALTRGAYQGVFPRSDIYVRASARGGVGHALVRESER